MGLPTPISDYLRGWCLEGRSPAYMEVAPDGRLLCAGGELERYGIELKADRVVTEDLPFLAGLLPVTNPLRLPCVSWGGPVVDLHGFPEDRSSWLLFLDAAKERDQRQRDQQLRNELALDREALRRRNDSLASALAALDLFVLSPLHSGLFDPLSAVPTWLHELWPEVPSVLDLGARFPFLDHFLHDAREVWATHAPRLRSGPWIETSPAGGEVALEATALCDGPRRLLVLERLGEAYEERRQQLQAARHNRLLYERLTQEMTRKDVLIHCIVHDLMGPLTSIRGCFELLNEIAPESDGELLSVGLSASAKQEAMIRDILAAFSAETEAVEGFTRDLATAPDVLNAIAAVQRALQPAFQREGVRLSHTPPQLADARVWGESSRLERVLSNLLENALRYSPKGSSVAIRVEVNPDSLRVCVEDEGSGVPPEAVDTLFEKFVQGAGGKGKVGLGLYFCRITVERWGGSIGCEPRPGGGSRFWFELERASG